jgi:hypothetical protein
MATCPTPFQQSRCTAKPRHRLTSKLRSQTELDVQPDVFSDEALEALVNEWIVPRIADRIIAEILAAEPEGCR